MADIKVRTSDGYYTISGSSGGTSKAQQVTSLAAALSSDYVVITLNQQNGSATNIQTVTLPIKLTNIAYTDTANIFTANQNFGQSISTIYKDTSNNNWYRIINNGYFLDFQWSTNEGSTWNDSARVAYYNGIMTSHLRTFTGDTYDIGQTDCKFKDLYLSGTANLGTKININSAGTDTSIFSISNYGNYTQIALGSNILSNYTANAVKFVKPITPETTGGTNIGTSSLLWNDEYLSGKIRYYYSGTEYANIGLSGYELAIHAGNGIILSGGGTRPALNDSMDLGSASYKFRDLYIGGIPCPVSMGPYIPSKGDGNTVYTGVGITSLNTAGAFHGAYIASAKRNRLYCLIDQPEYTCYCNYKGNGTSDVSPLTEGVWYAAHYTNTTTGTSGSLGNLFDNTFTTGATFPTTDLSTNPVVITVMTTGTTKIDATDTAYVVLNGWRYDGKGSSYNHYGYLNSYKLEICTDKENDTWVEVFNRTGVSDPIGELAIPTWSSTAGTSSYTSLFGFRLTISGATAQGITDQFGFTELKLMDNRPSGIPSDAVGALSLNGGTIYGNIILGRKSDTDYGRQSIRPYASGLGEIGNSSYPFNRVCANNIYSTNFQPYSSADMYVGYSGKAIYSRCKISPVSDITYDLGSASRYWNVVYTKSISIKSADYASTDDIVTISVDGGSAKTWPKTLAIDGACYTSSNFSVEGYLNVTGAELLSNRWVASLVGDTYIGGSLYTKDGLFPGTDTKAYSTANLGSSSNRWNALYVDSVNSAGIVPKVTDVFSLGDSTARWNYAFIKNAVVNNINNITVPTNTSGQTISTQEYVVARVPASVGSSTKPVYTNSNGVITEGSIYAGGTAITLNGTNKSSTTASFYAPTSAISTTTEIRYLVGSSSVNSVATENTNPSCYMQAGYLYSNGRQVLPVSTVNPAPNMAMGTPLSGLTIDGSSHNILDSEGYALLGTTTYTYENLGKTDLVTLLIYLHPERSKYKVVYDIRRPGITNLTHESKTWLGTTIYHKWYINTEAEFLNINGIRDHSSSISLFSDLNISLPTLSTYYLQAERTSGVLSKSSTDPNAIYGLNGNGTLYSMVSNSSSGGAAYLNFMAIEADDSYDGSLYLHDWHTQVIWYQK